MTTRQEKIVELLKEEISDILRREIKDPRLGFFTVIDAEITSDLRHAKVFVSIMGTEEERKQRHGGAQARAAFRAAGVRQAREDEGAAGHPVLQDETVDKGVRMLELLEEIKRDDEEQILRTPGARLRPGSRFVWPAT